MLVYIVVVEYYEVSLVLTTEMLVSLVSAMQAC